MRLEVNEINDGKGGGPASRRLQCVVEEQLREIPITGSVRANYQSVI
jgi:hypothetical protein